MANNSLIVEGLNIAELSDEKLAEHLAEFGFAPGPIVDSTRSVYQRKLARLLKNEETNEGSGLEEEVQDEEVRPTAPSFKTGFFQDYASPSTSYASEELRRRPISQLSASYYSDTTARLSSQSTWNPDDIVSQVAPPPGEMEKPLISTSAKIICLIVALIFILIVYYNMETAPDNPFSVPPASP